MPANEGPHSSDKRQQVKTLTANQARAHGRVVYFLGLVALVQLIYPITKGNSSTACLYTIK